MIEDLSGYVGNYDRVKTLDEFKRLVDKLYADDKTISFDVETGYTGPDTPKLSLNVYDPRQFVVGFAITNDVRWARYVPLLHDFGDNLDPNEVWSYVKPLLEDKIVVAHNKKFEEINLLALERKGHGPVIKLDWQKGHDPMIQSYTLSETRYHGLKPLTLERYNYEQMHIQALFDKITEKQMSSLRFNPLDMFSTKVVNYVCDDVTWTLRHDKDQRQRAIDERGFIYNMEREITSILVDMMETGINVDWDGVVTGLAQFENFYGLMENDLRKKFEELTGRDLTTLNFRSTQQMQKLLFDDEEGLGLTPAQKTKGGKPSTKDTSLEAIRHQNPAVEQLLKYRGAKKMGEWFGLWNGLRTSYDDRIHPNFKQTTVQSGRFACDAPNVQNITKKWWFTTIERDWTMFPKGKDDDFEEYVTTQGVHGSDYWTGNARDYIIASPGYTLLSFDYSQQEFRVLAGLAEESYLVEAFENDIDIHKATAALMFGVPLEEVTKDQRQRGKTLGFGNIYGQGPKALGDQLGISKKEAEVLFDKYFSAFKNVSNWFTKVKRQGMEKGYVESFFGRKSTLWDLQSEYEVIRQKGERMCVNVPVQGGGADITKLAMIRTKRMLTSKGWWNTKVRLLMNQHDSLVFEVSDDLDLSEVKELITPMVSFPIPGFPKFDIDWETGQKWGSCEKWEDRNPKEEPEVVKAKPIESEVKDLRIRFGNPTTTIAKKVIEALRNRPGERRVTFVMGDDEKAVKLGVDSSTLLLSEIRAVSEGTCQVELV